MNIRAASLCLLFVLATLPLQAQTPTPGGGSETIKFLYNELVALKARVAKLESGQINAADLVGTYAVYALGVELHGGFPAQIASETSVGTATLRADGTGSASGKDARHDLRQGTPWSRRYSESPWPPQSFTWSVVNGQLVVPGEMRTFVATIGAGGRLLIAGGTSTGGDGWSNIFMLIRLPNQ